MAVHGVAARAAAPVLGLAKRATTTSTTTTTTTAALSASPARCYSAPVGNAVPAAKKKYVPSRGTYPQGFRAGGVVVGVKPNNTTKPDLAMIVSDVPCAAAAVFTKNRFQAAPVTFSRELLRRAQAGGGPPTVRSVLINSGCANAVTGKGGLEDAAAMAAAADACTGAAATAAAATAGGSGTLVMSTGVIGQRLPIQKILDGVPRVVAGLGATHDHWMAAARAICTTDTFPKLLSRTFALPSAPGVEYRIAGTTKGAGMIHPNLATLLGVLATDAPLDQAALPSLLRHAIDRSFNSISIDGDTSTNDTVALLANGTAGGPVVGNDPASPDYRAFQAVLTDFAAALAQLVVRDGEGATKFVTIRVTEAASAADARRIASTIARSPLVKTALYGKDANWGRILCATGYALISEPGAPDAPDAPDAPGADAAVAARIVPAQTSVSFLPTDGSPELKLLVHGEPEAVDEARAAEILELEDLEILVRLGTGSAEATYWSSDFSHEYVTINGDYRT